MTTLWANEQDISQDAVLENICKKLNINFSELKKQAETEEIKNIYLSNSQEAIDKGVFGAPSFILDDELFWGQDRLDFLEDKIKSI